MKMIQELTASVRRWAGMPTNQPEPLVRFGDKPEDAMDLAHADLGSLRGMTPAAADQAQCTCPESCERDHANE
jgi:hypothetical protein